MDMSPEELRALLAGEPDAHDYEQDPPSGIDDESANYHLGRALTIREEAEWTDQMFKAEIERLTARRKERLEVADGKARWHERAVEGWHRARLAADRKAKTIHLPAGVSSLRRAQPVLEVDDEEHFRAWASTVGTEEGTLEDLIWPKKPRELAKGALRKVLKPAGSGSEPGSTLAAVHPDTGAKAEGMKFRAVGESHNLKRN